MSENKLSILFSQNRTENLNTDDLWGEYVIPLNYSQYNLLKFTKATHVVGGRGSGKTAYLKYHCFQTRLSPKRLEINDEELKDIGLYWKPDTDFLKTINEKYLGDKWVAVFNTYVGLSLISELSKFVTTLINSNYDLVDSEFELKNLIIKKDVAKFLNVESDIKFTDLDERCQFYRSELNDWLNFPLDKPPVIFAAKDKLLYLIEYILKKIKCLENTCFHIFIDEYENLMEIHRKIINTWLKHSSYPLVFCVAYKKHYKIEAMTTGTENLTNIHDYNVVDIEANVYGEKNYSILSAEILLNNIQKFYINENRLSEKIIEFNLSSTEHLIHRNNPLYKRRILQKIRKILPSYSLDALSDCIFTEKSLLNKLKEMMKTPLSLSSYNVNDFINKEYKKESIVNGCLLNRKHKECIPRNLKKSFDTVDKKYSEWINSSCLATILYLYSTYSEKVCPYYGGFNRFVLMSKNNVRHLLALCHKSLVEYEMENIELPNIDDLVVPVELQAKAAFIVSKEELEHKLPDLSHYGKQLQRIVERLGDLYVLSQKRKSQSEPEKNHFSVIGYNIEKDPDDGIVKLVNEAKIWSVLIAKKNSKSKGVKDKAYYEYHLHSIFAPFFGISPRQKRKFEFDKSSFLKIFDFSTDGYEELYNDYAKKFENEEVISKQGRESNLMDFMNNGS